MTNPLSKVEQAEAEEFLREFEHVQSLVRKWGWVTALPDDGDDSPCAGMVIGSPEYVDKVLVHLEPGEHWRSDEDEPSDLPN